MPMVNADGCLLNVSVEGRDGGPTLMLSNSLGCTLQMWEPQMEALTRTFRVIRYDRRGHGKSGVPPGPYTACYYPDPTNWLNRIKVVKEGGIAAVADAVIAGWLTADFREREPKIAARMKAMLVATPAPGYLACCEALSTLDQRVLLPKIKSPTLVIAGRHDMATPVAAGELIRSHIPGASMTVLEAAHISNVEQPHAFAETVIGFLTQR